MSVKRLVSLNTVSLASDPASPKLGDIYLNSTTNNLKVYTETGWQNVGAASGAAVHIGTTPPNSAAEGDLWYNNVDPHFYTYDGTFWVEISFGPVGPAGPGLAVGGTTGQIATKASNTDFDVVWTNPYTNTNARAAISGGTGIDYNNTSGVIAINSSVTTNSGSQTLTNKIIGSTGLGFNSGANNSAIYTEGNDMSVYANSTLYLNANSNVIIQPANGYYASVRGDILATLNAAQTLSNKTLTSPVINNPTGITKTDVGLANVDNTSDANKPISTATQTALNLKAPLASPSLTGTPLAPTATSGTNTTQIATTAFVQSAITGLINGAPSTLDTLKELSDALNSDSNFAGTITTSLAGKVAKSGDTMTGALTLSANPTDALHAVTKQYVDSSVTSLSNTASSTYIPQSDAGNPDGVATLDSNGYVPMSQLVNLINNAPANLDTLGEIYNYMLDREIDIIMGAA